MQRPTERQQAVTTQQHLTGAAEDLAQQVVQMAENGRTAKVVMEFYFVEGQITEPVQMNIRFGCKR